MGLSQWLATLASGSTPPVFLVAGTGSLEAIARLQVLGAIRVVDSPAAATLLLVAGEVPPPLWQPLMHVHDGMPHPRGTLHLPLGADQGSLPTAAHARIAHVEDEAPDIIRETFRELVTGTRASDPPLLPDVDPNPWRGVGPYGQGGSGMTGGNPYGRPMAELAADRDGLRLDVLPLQVGPFFPRFGTGVMLDATLAGDVIVEARLADSPFTAAAEDRPSSIFRRALTEPVSIAELEVARARDHLRWAARALVAMGVPALAERALRLSANAAPADAARVTAFERRLRLLRIPAWQGRGRGRLESDAVRGLGLGPVSRASGVGEDARAEEPTYQSLGFETIVGTAGDAAERWSLRLLEAARSLDLAGRAGTARAGGSGVVESPRGLLTVDAAPYARVQPLISDLLEGLEWGDAVTTIVSLDIDATEVTGVLRREAAA